MFSVRRLLQEQAQQLGCSKMVWMMSKFDDFLVSSQKLHQSWSKSFNEIVFYIVKHDTFVTSYKTQ